MILNTSFPALMGANAWTMVEREGESYIKTVQTWILNPPATAEALPTVTAKANSYRLDNGEWVLNETFTLNYTLAGDE